MDAEGERAECCFNFLHLWGAGGSGGGGGGGGGGGKEAGAAVVMVVVMVVMVLEAERLHEGRYSCSPAAQGEGRRVAPPLRLFPN